MSRLILLFLLSVAWAKAGPDDIPNLAFALEGETLDGLADGAEVTSWADPYNGANSATPATATRPTKQTFNGMSVCRFASGGGDRLISNSFLDSGFDTSFTIIYVAQSLSTSGLRCVAANGSTSQRWFGEQKATGLHYQTGIVPATSQNSLPGHASINEWAYDGTNLKHYVNGLLKNTFSAAGTLGASGALTIGETTGGGQGLNGYVRRIYVYNGLLDSTQRASLASWIAARDVGFAGTEDIVMGIGDSQSGITSCEGGAFSYISKLKEFFEADGYHYNYVTADAVSGRTLQDMIDSAPINVDPYIQAPNLAGRNLLLIWGGENSISSGLTGAQAETQLQTLISGRRSAAGSNLAFVLLTTLPVDGDPAPKAAERADFNSRMVANCDSYSDVPVVVVRLDQIPELTDPASLVYFCDGVHLTDAGKLLVAEATYDVILDLPPPSVTGSTSFSGSGATTFSGSGTTTLQ